MSTTTGSARCEQTVKRLHTCSSCMKRGSLCISWVKSCGLALAMLKVAMNCSSRISGAVAGSVASRAITSGLLNMSVIWFAPRFEPAARTSSTPFFSAASSGNFSRPWL